MEEPQVVQPDPTAVPGEPPPDAPFVLSLVVWVGVFSAVVWGMMALFRQRPRPGEPAAPE